MYPPKIWKVCIIQMSKGYGYSSVNYSNFMKYPHYYENPDYKVVVVTNFYGKASKRIIFRMIKSSEIPEIVWVMPGFPGYID
jgi:hypothetical protein